MKRALLWLCVACCCSITAGASAEDMFSVLKETRKLVREGKYEEALERYEAAYENALLDPTNDRLSSIQILHAQRQHECLKTNSDYSSTRSNFALHWPQTWILLVNSL